MEEVKEYVSKDVEQEALEVPTVQVMPETGTIMDAVQMSEENNKQREAMEAAISNDQMKRFETMAKAWQEAHTQKVRKFDKVRYFGKEYFIKGRMSSGYAVLMDIDGNKVDFSSLPKGYKTPKLCLCKRISARRDQLICVTKN